ncbi:MAG: cyclic nucleotide-binding domain-containing protein [Mariprofundaceae bacterium]
MSKVQGDRKGIPDHYKQALLKFSTALQYQPGEVVCHEGDNDRKLFILTDGTLHVVRNDAEGRQMHIATLQAGDLFGELNFVFGKNRVASVIADTQVIVHVLDRSHFSHITERMPELYNCLENIGVQRWSESILLTHPLLQSLPDRQRRTFIDQATVITVAAGGTLLSAGQQLDIIWFLLSGNIDLVDKQGNDIEVPDEFCLLPATCLQNEPNDCRAIAITECICTGLPLAVIQDIAVNNDAFAHALENASF